MARFVTLRISKITTRWITGSQRSEITISWSTVYSAGTEVLISKYVHKPPCSLAKWPLSVLHTFHAPRLDPKSAFFLYITGLDTLLILYANPWLLKHVRQHKPTKCTFSELIFNFWFFDVFYMFRTRGFVFRKAVVCTVKVWYVLHAEITTEL